MLNEFHTDLMGIFTYSGVHEFKLEYASTQQKFTFIKESQTLYNFFALLDIFRLSFISKVDSLLGEK
jgi:hypothetical protein